ncbi:MAG: anti-sigma factor domain-containing protein [Flavisolibacter sp.]
MGLVTESERQEFESFCSQYPEIAAARNAYELALEEKLLSDAKQPPQKLKQLIEEKIAAPSTENYTDELQEEVRPVRRIGVWKWVAAASLILMAGSIYWAVTTNKKYEQVVAKNDVLQKKLDQSGEVINGYAEMKKDMETFENIRKSGVRMAAIKSNSDPRMSATIYWDTTTRDVYLMINNMPEPPTDKQYQLWALFKGQPINLGSMEVTQKRLLYAMKNVQNAEAFAISIEPKGSNPEKPTTAPVALTKL